MKNSTMNYKAVLDKYSSNGNSLVETFTTNFDDNGNPIKGNPNFSLKASASLIQAVFEDVKNLDVSEFGDYMLGFTLHICELVTTKGTSEDIKSIDKMACMPLVCLDTVCDLYGVDFTKKVTEGFKDMFLNIPKRTYECLCNCFNILIYYIVLSSLGTFHYTIDVSAAADYLISIGDTKYSNYKSEVEGYDWGTIRSDLLEMRDTEFCN